MAKVPVEDPPTRLAVLRDNEAMLRRLLVDAEPQHAAALARELRATVREIEEAERSAAPERSLSDELAAKRRARVSAGDPPPASRRGQARRRGGEHRAG